MTELSILIVDDNLERSSKLKDALASGAQVARMDVVTNAAAARTSLNSTAYDILILDVAIPKFRDTEANRDEGAWLLREIHESGSMKRPRHIIGITAYEEVHASANGAFDQSFARLIHTSDFDDGWISHIIEFARYLVQCDLQLVSKVDVAVLTALWTPEFDALLGTAIGLKEVQPLDDSTRLWSANVQGLRTVAACAPRMGPVSAAILATKVCTQLRPKMIMLVGICAGLKNEVALGDVVISTDVQIWDSGKLTHGGGFSPAPVSLPVQEALISSLRGHELPKVIADLWIRYDGEKPNDAPKVHFGPIASGTAVIADDQVIARIKAMNRKVMAIDMEAYAVHAACASSSRPQPAVLTVKAVCDFGDKEKNSSIQPFTAAASAALAAPILSMIAKRGLL